MSETEDVCPRGMKLGAFRDNLAHSCKKYGLVIYPEFIPRERPCDKNDFPTNNAGIEAKFERFTAYKNEESGAITEKIGKVILEEFKVFDNGHSGIEVSIGNEASDMETKIKDALVVGYTEEA